MFQGVVNLGGDLGRWTIRSTGFGRQAGDVVRSQPDILQHKISFEVCICCDNQLHCYRIEAFQLIYSGANRHVVGPRNKIGSTVLAVNDEHRIGHILFHVVGVYNRQNTGL